jgi:hypothetical protein
VTGSAHVAGRHEFLLDPDAPLADGFLFARIASQPQHSKVRRPAPLLGDSMRNVIIASALLLLAPSAVQAQAGTSVAYRPNPAAARLQGDANAARLRAAQDTVATTVDSYGVDDSVVYGAAIGGIIGGVAVAVHTISDNETDPVSWGVAVAAPIVGGLIGAGVGWLIR